VHDIGKNIVGVVLQCNNYEVIDLGVMVPAAKILETAREKKADIIGLSGLITPSLDEMVHVAQEMEREKFSLPLLIGGATTSRAHTAVKIEPQYRANSTVHVLDASRAVGVVNNLLNTDANGDFTAQIRADYQRLREEYAAKTTEKKLLPLEWARARKPKFDWNQYQPPVPDFTGVRTEEPSLETLIDYIDWSPFFHTWELRGRYPAIFDDPTVGKQARELFDDAQSLMERIISEKLLTARGVFAFWPGNSLGDDVELYEDAERTKHLATFHFLRQQMQKPADQFNHCLADYVAPKSGASFQLATQTKTSETVASRVDFIGGFAVTAGLGADELAQKFAKEHDDYQSILTKALADRLAEAFAEYLHKQARIAWGFGADEKLTNEELIRERYQGIRPAAGYPASPDHTEKQTLFNLLDAEENTGIRLTESFAMHPGASVSGLYFSHPESKYFAVGKIDRDQVGDYATRKKMPNEWVEKWLAPNLSY
jgi:5-methyltetrahydrofolate--homocysteine methyltransferase